MMTPMHKSANKIYQQIHLLFVKLPDPVLIE